MALIIESVLLIALAALLFLNAINERNLASAYCELANETISFQNQEMFPHLEKTYNISIPKILMINDCPEPLYPSLIESYSSKDLKGGVD
jgi:hypothetical protein